jgi:hypothetical protein
MLSNLGDGYINKDWFELKEGYYYSYIRRLSTDDSFFMRSAQGLGSVLAVNSTTPSATVLTFSFDLGTIISVGDVAYVDSSGTPVELGPVTSKTSNTLTIDTTVIGGSIPTNGQFVMFLKNSVAESYGLSGYYCQFKLTNESTSRAELFAAESDAFKSYV